MENIGISINDISFSYGNNEERLLNGITINIKKGEFIGILGPNGCGKSTLLKIILKYLPVEGGYIKISDENLKNYSQKELSKILSFVPQKSALSMPLTVEDLIYMGRTPHMKSRWSGFDREDKKKVDEILKILNVLVSEP